MCGASAQQAAVIGKRLNSAQGLRPTKRIGVATTVVRCRNCGLIFCNPMPIPLDIEQHYGKPPDAYWQAHYFATDDRYFQPQIGRFRRLWDGDRTPVALDIGAGIGKAMASLAANGFDTYGLEPSEPFLNHAVEHTGIEASRLQRATIEDADLPAGRFDFVSFGAVLEHLCDPAAAIEKALDWTAPNGLIQIEVPSARWLTSRLANRAYRLQGLDYASNLSPMHIPYHLYEFTLDSFRQHAARTKYQLAGHHRLVIGRTFLPQSLDALGVKVMKATRTGMQLEVWLRNASPSQSCRRLSTFSDGHRRRIKARADS